MDVSLRETRSPGRCWRRCARAGRGRVGAEPAGRAGEARGPPCGERPAVVAHSAAGRPLAPFPRRASLELWARCWRKAVLEAPWGAAGLLGSVHTPRAHDFHEGSPGRGACPAPGTGRWPGSPGAALLWWRLLREVTLASQLTRATLAFQSRGSPACHVTHTRGGGNGCLYGVPTTVIFRCFPKLPSKQEEREIRGSVAWATGPLRNGDGGQCP